MNGGGPGFLASARSVDDAQEEEKYCELFSPPSGQSNTWALSALDIHFDIINEPIEEVTLQSSLQPSISYYRKGNGKSIPLTPGCSSVGTTVDFGVLDQLECMFPLLARRRNKLTQPDTFV